MDEPREVRFAKGLGGLSQDANDAARVLGAVDLHEVLQVDPLEVFHGVVEDAVRSATEVVDGDRVGVGEATRLHHLPLEAANRGFPGFLGRQELDRGRALEERVLAAIDGAHPPFAELLHQTVLTELERLPHALREAVDRVRYDRRPHGKGDAPERHGARLGLPPEVVELVGGRRDRRVGGRREEARREHPHHERAGPGRGHDGRARHEDEDQDRQRRQRRDVLGQERELKRDDPRDQERPDRFVGVEDGKRSTTALEIEVVEGEAAGQGEVQEGEHRARALFEELVADGELGEPGGDPEGREEADDDFDVEEDPLLEEGSGVGDARPPRPTGEILDDSGPTLRHARRI